MRVHEMKKEFYKRIKADVDTKGHAEKVRQSLIKHKHRVSQEENKGDNRDDR